MANGTIYKVTATEFASLKKGYTEYLNHDKKYTIKEKSYSFLFRNSKFLFIKT